MCPRLANCIHGGNCHQIAVNEDCVQVWSLFQQTLYGFRSRSVGEVSILDQAGIDIPARFLKSCLISIQTVLHFHFISWTSNETNFLPSRADQMLCCQLSALKVISGHRTTFLTWLRNPPYDERSIHFYEGFHMMLLITRGH